MYNMGRVSSLEDTPEDTPGGHPRRTPPEDTPGGQPEGQDILPILLFINNFIHSFCLSCYNNIMKLYENIFIFRHSVPPQPLADHFQAFLDQALREADQVNFFFLSLLQLTKEILLFFGIYFFICKYYKKVLQSSQNYQCGGTRSGC
jgi:hypothetical protein